MTEQAGAIQACAVSDGDDRLLSADEPLAGLQRRCGGDLPGVIAVPELLALVRRARLHGLPISGQVNTHDGLEAVTAWLDVEPQATGAGCLVRLRHWQSAPLAPDDGAVAEGRRLAIDRHLAELSVHLDAAQRVLAATGDATDLADAISRLDEAAGQHWTDVLVPESVAHQQPLHWRLLDGVQVTAPGSSRPWKATFVPRALPGAEPSGFELLLSSEEPAPIPAETTAEPAIASHSLVSEDLAPALRQPIARIIANAETIRTRLAGPLPDAYADYAGEIASAGKLLLGLLEDLADLEVVESANFTTVPDEIDLSEVARQAAGILGVRAREKAIVVAAPPISDVMPALGEFRRVLQVLLNLVGNAIRYSPERSRVSIGVERRGDRARVVVADEGRGLSLDEQAKVFDKFERLGRSGDGGSGLGLYISRSLARAMDGDLSVESAPGQGARFILELPVDPAG